MARADEYDHLHLVFYFTVPLMVFLDNLVIVPALERCSWYFDNFQILNCVSFALILNPLMANITKWSNTLKQFVGKLATNCLSVFDHFVGLALKELNNVAEIMTYDNFAKFTGKHLCHSLLFNKVAGFAK